MRPSRPRILHVPGALLVLLAALPPAQAQVIDTGTPPTVPNWPIFAFGRGTEVSYASYGQSFTVPTAGPTQLSEFQFWLRDNLPTGTTPYYAYVFGWDPTTRQTSGSYLFRSTPQEYTGAATPTPFSFVTGGLNLTAGQTYIAVLSSVEFPDAPTGLRPGITQTTSWPNDTYAGGSSYVRFGPSGLSTLTGGAWNLAGGTGTDLAFRATLSAAGTPAVVPEPATSALLATGVVGLLAIARRRRG